MSQFVTLFDSSKTAQKREAIKTFMYENVRALTFKM